MSVLDGLSHLQEALCPLLLMETLKKDWKFQGQNPCLKCWQPVQFCAHSRLSGSIQHLFPKMPNTEFFQHHALYTMEYYSAIKKNSFESVLMRWMKLEPIIQSEVSQKDKDH